MPTYSTHNLSFSFQSAEPHLFAFNGQEKDDEVSDAGNTNTAMFWEYDTRSGRRWNLDPLSSAKPWITPYHAFSNKPILNKDPNGAYDEVFINSVEDELNGDTKQTDLAVAELSKSAPNLKIYRTSTGQIKASGTAVTPNEFQLLNAINDPNIVVKVNASSDSKLAGKFLGAVISKNTEVIPLDIFNKSITSTILNITTSASTQQDVNPENLAIIDNVYKGTPGQSMLHEVIESFIGGEIAIRENKDIEKAWITTDLYGKEIGRSPDYDFYNEAHTSAPKPPVEKVDPAILK